MAVNQMMLADKVAVGNYLRQAGNGKKLCDLIALAEKQFGKKYSRSQIRSICKPFDITIVRSYAARKGECKNLTRKAFTCDCGRSYVVYVYKLKGVGNELS